MHKRINRYLTSVRHGMRATITGPHVLAFLPATALGAFWLGGEQALLLTALGLPALFALSGGFEQFGPGFAPTRDKATGLQMRDELETVLDNILAQTTRERKTSACFLLELDDFDAVKDRFGQSGTDQILHQVGDRLRTVLRTRDAVFKFSESCFAIALSPAPYLDVETSIQMAARLQASVEEPISLDATTVYVSCSIGYCLASRAPQQRGSALILAAKQALTTALQHGPSAIRMFADDMNQAQGKANFHRGDVAKALNDGQIVPWFQPQISTDTGMVTGFEALARWCHPERGLIPPAEFLPDLQRGNMLERLGEVILYNALSAVRSWAAAGFDVPKVGVNFTSEELRNPKLLEKLEWELDRFNLAADRLAIEVLETVVALSPEDIIARNINGLAKMGCSIDLDDFGTGHASISSIRRFAVERIKIDRSFVMKVDRDADQQKMVSAILSMAERLGLDTLAEGVETAGEHAMLAQLGCRHVQGFGIGRPMPFEHTMDWIRTHNAKLAQTPLIGRQTG